MKNLFTFLLICLLAQTVAFAQTANAVLFTENGERFTVILNGVRQNQRPETNVKLTGLTAENYKMRIIFEDKRLGVMDNTLYVYYGDEITYAIRKKKSKYVLRFVSQSNIGGGTANANNYNNNGGGNSYNNNGGYNNNNGANGGYNNGGYNPTPTPPRPNGGSTTTTTTNGGVAVNGQISVGGVTIGGQVNTGNSTTTTTNGNTGVVPPPPYVLPGYTGVYGCPYPMQPDAFQAAKNSIAKQPFDDNKLMIAKQVITSNCLLTSQVKELAKMFTFEDRKLEFAKFAYGYTLDINNYFVINDVFTFPSSVEDLNDYIVSYRR